MLIDQNFTELADIKYVKAGPNLKFLEMQLKSNISVNRKPITVFDVNVEVTDLEIMQELLRILNEHRNCIAKSAYNVSFTDIVEIKINLTTDRLLVQRPRRYSESERAQIRKIVNEFLSWGIIRESTSPFANNVLLVKKIWEKRLCVDYRNVNEISLTEKYPLPIIEEQINRLSGYKYFCCLDLASGYHQIKMSEESILITAFITQDDHYEFLRVQKHGLKLKLNKCFFLRTPIEFHQIREFLGLTGYFRKFISNYAD